MTDVQDRYIETAYAHTFYGTAVELKAHMEKLGPNFAYEDLGDPESPGEEHEWRIMSRRQPDRAGQVVLAQREDGSVRTGIPQHVASAPLMWKNYKDTLLDDEGVKAQWLHHPPVEDDGWRVTDLGPAPEIEDALHPPRVERHSPVASARLADSWKVTGRTTSVDGSPVYPTYDTKDRPDLKPVPEDEALHEAIDQLKHSLSDVWENVVGLVRIFFAKS